MNYLERSKTLLLLYDSITWELYFKLCDDILYIDKDLIEEELSKQPALYAYYAACMNRAKKELDEANASLEVISATVKNSLLNGPKLSDKKLDIRVNTDESYQQANAKVIELTNKYSMFRSIVSALEHRKDCLIQLSSNNRAEMKLHS